MGSRLHPLLYKYIPAILELLNDSNLDILFDDMFTNCNDIWIQDLYIDTYINDNDSQHMLLSEFIELREWRNSK